MLPLDRNRSWGLNCCRTTRFKRDRDFSALVYVVTPGYIPPMGMQLRAGRDFAWNDTPASPHVVIINKAAARREWPGQNAVGKMANGYRKRIPSASSA